MREMFNKVFAHLADHPGRLVGTNAGVLAAVQAAPVESWAKAVLVILTCVLTGTTVYQRWRGAKSKGPGRPTRILMVDDSPEDTALLSRALRRHHCEVTVVHSHADALVELRGERRYDFVLLDAKMPGEEPGELFRQIRNERPRLSVAIFAGVVDAALVESVSQHGFAIFVRKPTNGIGDFIEELAVALRIR